MPAINCLDRQKPSSYTPPLLRTGLDARDKTAEIRLVTMVIAGRTPPRRCPAGAGREGTATAGLTIE